MTDPLTDAYLDAIEQRAHAATEGPWEASAHDHAAGDVPALLAEVRRLRAMEQRVREYARHLARPFADGAPDWEGEQIASELLAALDGGE